MPKRRKRAGNFIVRDNIDRISKLPDEALCRVLSHLQTKEAAATSILSKRWKNVWNSISNHNCSEELQCSSVREFSRQSIGVNDLPRSIFTCKTLVDLKIKGAFVLNLPSCICMPNLKTLHLESVIYVDDASAQRLFSGCTRLEELDIVRKGRDGVKILSISVPLLKSLSISFSEFNIDKGDRYETKINAPILEYLVLKDAICEDYLLIPSLSLTEAYVYCKCLYGVFRGVQNVSFLTLSGNIMESLNKTVRDHDLPKFNNLSNLEMGVDARDYIDWSFLPKLLESTPNLENLVFPKGLAVRDYTGRNFRRFYWKSPVKVPECVLSKLKTVEINFFAGMPGEKHLVLFFLGFAEVLESMTIQCYDHGRKCLPIAKKEILHCFMASEECEVEFFG